MCTFRYISGAIFHKGDEDLVLAFDEAIRDLDNEQNKIVNLKPIKKTNVEFESFKVATIGKLSK